MLRGVLAIARGVEHIAQVHRETVDVSEPVQKAELISRHQRRHDANGRAKERPAARGRLDGNDAELLVLRREQHRV